MFQHRPGVTILTHVAMSLAALMLPAIAIADDHAFLDRLDTVVTIASTVPANGDVNPYGVAVVPKSIGVLKRGNVLVSNFNNMQNQQGTGSTIVQVAPSGVVTVFAQIENAQVAGQCPGGVGLTTALVVLRRGWVIVGSLPTTDGTSATMSAGCLIVLDSEGEMVETFQGNGIAGPWDMTAVDDDDRAWLFVTNVLNGDVAAGSPHEVDQGTVLRIPLRVPQQGKGMPSMGQITTIGSGFAEIADPSALVIGPTGVGLGRGGTLYVADTFHSRIAAIPRALTRSNTAFTGITVTANGALMGPLGLAIAPDGHIITANAGDGNLVETVPGGAQLSVRTVDTATGAGSLFGIAIVPQGRGVYFVDDGDNTLKVLLQHEDADGHGEH